MKIGKRETTPLHSTQKRRKKRGFSFIEVMVVIIILGLLTGTVGVYLFNAVGEANVDTTKTQIRNLGTALDLYRLHNSRYPTTEQGLNALVSKPDVGTVPRNWNGPYVQGGKLPVDAWGNDYRYSSDGNSYEIVSLGADGAEGGAEQDADINSKDI